MHDKKEDRSTKYYSLTTPLLIKTATRKPWGTEGGGKVKKNRTVSFNSTFTNHVL